MAEAGIPSILEKIIARKRERLEEARAREPEAALRRRASDSPTPRDFAAALRGEGVRIIAEIKRRSPSAGLIREDVDPATLAKAYHCGGADAISVLTEQDFFDGRLAYLKAVRQSCPLPILRKDFLFDPYQLYEARACGADAVLLIVAALQDGQLKELHDVAAEQGLAALVEVHDDRELERALDAGARIIGINNRDLRTFQVTLETSMRLAPTIPADRVIVGESGIREPEDIRRLAAAGVGAFLIGEQFMRAANVAAEVRRMKGALGAAGRSRGRS